MCSWAALSCISLQIDFPVLPLRLALVSILELHTSVWLQQSLGKRGPHALTLTLASEYTTAYTPLA